SAAPEVQLCSAFTLAAKIRDFDTLCSKAFSGADLPAAPNLAARRWGLRNDPALRNIGTEELPVENQFQILLLCKAASVCDRLAGEVGHGYFSSVNRKAHRDQRGNQRDHDHDKRDQRKAKKCFQVNALPPRQERYRGCLAWFAPEWRGDREEAGNRPAALQRKPPS